MKTGFWPGAVVAVEALGHEQLSYFDVPDEVGWRVVSRVAGRLPVSTGDELPLRIDPTARYFL